MTDAVPADRQGPHGVRTKKGPFCALEEIELDIRSGRVRLDDRAFRVRQVDAAQHRHRVGSGRPTATSFSPT